MSRALWIADALRSYGVEVIETQGWKTRGLDTLDPKLVICHHTASSATSGPAPSLSIVTNGRAAVGSNPAVPGPLCNVLLGRDGIARVIASGKSNNAGTGAYRGITGNAHTLGVEAENNGVGEPWGATIYNAYVKVAAALRDGAGLTTDDVIGHKEWTTRKIDPSFDMRLFRSRVSATTHSPPHVEVPPPAPVPEPDEDEVADMYVALLKHSDGRVFACTETKAVHLKTNEDVATFRTYCALKGWKYDDRAKLHTDDAILRVLEVCEAVS